MREIFFRGKRVDNGKWVEGYYVYDESGQNAEKDIAFIYHLNKHPCGYALIPYEVIPETVGQYTGLRDCKRTEEYPEGQKIFEGDIINCWSEGVNAQGTVQQRRDGLWIIYPSWQKNIMWGLCPDEYSNTTVEVIGNIHDNPELIGGEENA